MDEQQQRIYSLMSMAEDQQKTIGAALEALAAERAALAKERAAVAQTVANMKGAANDVRKAAADAVPSLQKAVEGAVDASVRESLVDASEAATEAFEVASKPIIGRLSGVTHSLGEMENRMSEAVRSFGWRWAIVAGGAAAGAIACVLLAGWLSVWWQRHQVETLVEQKVQLQADVNELQTNVDALAKKGGRIKLERCGPDSRLCVEITPNQGKGLEDFLGSWANEEKTRRYVIPKGY